MGMAAQLHRLPALTVRESFFPPSGGHRSLCEEAMRLDRASWKIRGPRRLSRSAGVIGGLLLLAALLPVGAAAAQADTIVIAGERYAAGRLGRSLLGTGYRNLWSTPIEVPILHPDTFMGGLTLIQRGSGLQTASLRFAAPDKRQYVFRSVDKNQSGGLHPDLRGTLVSAIAQDQVSAKHPAGARVAGVLLEAAGVLHASPRLMVMADDPILGEYRAEFAGMLGILEDYPEDVRDGGGGFGGLDRVVGSSRMLERLVESTEDRVDAAAYARVRLIDFLIGDWDRHPDQWRWAAPDADGRRRWTPIPRDRDNAFSNVGGLIAGVAGALRSNVTGFGDTYPDLYVYLHNAQPLDRRILLELEREDWDAIASDLTRRLTDEVIAAAVDSLPTEYQPLGGDALAASLRARRDALTALAREVYLTLATEVDIHATDIVDVAELHHQPNGDLVVRLRDGRPDGDIYFERRIVASDTREVRVYLGDGDDIAIIRGGNGPLVKVRIIGGFGDDVVVDSVKARGGERTLFFDDSGVNRIEGTRAVRLFDDVYVAPESGAITENNAPGQRDWGSSFSLLSPDGDWMSNVGPVVGVGPSWKRYGFRRAPFARQTSVRIEWAPLHTRFGIIAEHRRVITGGAGETRFGLHATDISVTRFHGYGNETSPGPDSEWRRVWARELGAEIQIERRWGEILSLVAGPIASYLDPSAVSDSPGAQPGLPGAAGYGAAGMVLGAELDGRDSDSYPRRGFRVEASAAAYPFTWGDGAPEAFSTARLTGSAYLPVPFPLETTLAVRAGGGAVSDDAPLQYAAFLGGGSSLRGYSSQRFAGERAGFGGAELRILLGRANLLIARGDLGIIALADAGRVWVDGEDSHTWHTGFGGGLWFGPFERSLTLRALYAYGEKHRVSVGLGAPF